MKQFFLNKENTRVFEVEQSKLDCKKRQVLQRLLEKEKIIVFIGGDHSCTASVVNIFDKVEKIIVFDAHNDNEIKAKELKNWNFLAYLEFIREGLIIGYRQKNKLMPVKSGFQVIKDYECKDYYGMTERIIEFCKGIKNIYVSVDLDVLNFSEMPGVSFPVGGGIELTELLFLLHCIAKQKLNVVLDIVEFNPRIEREHSQKTVFRLLEELYDICEEIVKGKEI